MNAAMSRGGHRHDAWCAAFVTIVLCALAPLSSAEFTLPTFSEVQAAYVTSEATLLDRRGTPVSEIRVDTRVRRLQWVALADISPTMAATLVAAEDRRFYEHHGVDWSGLAGSAWDSAWRVLDGRRPRGGSTLTMQLAAFLDPALAPPGATRTLAQKWDQAQAALALERAWTKPQILEAYLNLASYRGELTGVAAASQGLFGKVPAGIEAREAAILVALLRNPNAPAATVAQRACAMAALSGPGVDCADIRASVASSLTRAYRIAPRWNDAPHVAAKLLKHPGEKLVSTLDAGLQRYATTALSERLTELAGRDVGDGALVVLDNATGEVLAYVGSAGAMASAAKVDGVAALRQPGSTLKPFLYALALDAKVLTAASLVDDSSVAIATGRGMYVPQNYDRDFKGEVSVRTALASSLNVPAVRTLELVGIDRFLGTLRALGFDTLVRDEDFYGAALALGDADVTLLSLANAYRTLANGGVTGPARFIAAPNAADSGGQRRVFGRAASFIVSDILADRGARALSFGLENPLATRAWSAVKTGTSKDMRDNWCIGYTSRYTVAVWVGNFSGAPMKDVSGVSGAAPLWRDVVSYLHANDPSSAPSIPSGVDRRAIAFDPPVEAPRDEWFVRGTDTDVIRSAASSGLSADGSGRNSPRIRYPAAGAIIALDPDIPDGAQRVVFEAAPADMGLRWRLDGREVGGGNSRARVGWAPTSGRHTLVLEDAAGRMLSAVVFEVRGSAAPTVAALSTEPAPASEAMRD
jgi:penicillin-binding protein 1C